MLSDSHTILLHTGQYRDKFLCFPFNFHGKKIKILTVSMFFMLTLSSLKVQYQFSIFPLIFISLDIIKHPFVRRLS